MVNRICPKCNIVFDRKSNYDYHINKKFDCTPNNNNSINLLNKKNTGQIMCSFVQNPCSSMPNQNLHNNNVKNNMNVIFFSCSYCNKNFSSKSTLTRHLKDNCKAKKNSDNEKENIFKLLLEKDKQYKEEVKQHKEEVNELKKQNKLLLDRIDKLINMKENSKITNNNISNSNNLSNSNNISNSNNTQNIVMVNFGNEDLSIIDKKLFMDRIVKKQITGVKIPDEILKIIHFNPEYPQLSNIYISDINREKCMIYESGEWKLTPSDKIPEIIDKVVLFSNEAESELREQFPNNKKINDRLDIIKKYNNMNDQEYIQELKDAMTEEEADNTDLIKKCEDFQKFTYDTFKTTLYNEGKKIKNKIK